MKRLLGYPLIAAVIALGAAGPACAQDPAPLRVVLLGTAGGPAIKAARAQPGNAVVVNGDVYIVDTGNGVARQMALADVSAQALRAVFLTHLHSDHSADYGTLLVRAWASGVRHNIDTYGPPPLERMTRAYLEYMSWDIELRVVDENRPPLEELIRAHEIERSGVIYRDDNVIVTAAVVPHGSASPSFAFRFDTAHGSVVFSGDTTYSDALIALARGADVLVHEVVSVVGSAEMANRIDPGNEELLRHMIEVHTPAAEVGRVAAAAGVGRLVLSHFVPTGLPGIDEPRHWLEGVREHFSGEVVVGEDLMEIVDF